MPGLGAYDSRHAARIQPTASASCCLGKISAGYARNPAWRIYARISQGYKPGGFNLAPNSIADAQPYGSERAMRYELGARLTSPALSGHFALYQIEVKDAQLYHNTVGYQTLRNIGDARSTGAEFDTSWALAATGSMGSAVDPCPASRN